MGVLHDYSVDNENSLNFTVVQNGTNATTETPLSSTVVQNGTNTTGASDVDLISILVPTIFALIMLVGLVGNVLVLLVVIKNKQMRNTTNLLITNLAISDLLFITICVPLTAVMYTDDWPFGSFACKLTYYMIHTTAWASVYTLVLMSLDRYLAVVHPVRAMSIRTQANAIKAIFILWVLVLLLNIPAYNEYSVRTIDFKINCIDLNLFNGTLNDTTMGPNTTAKVFYFTFFFFAYILPLFGICLLYFFMLKRLLFGRQPGGRSSAESNRAKKRVTCLVVIVVVVFAACWLPIQVMFLLRTTGYKPNDVYIWVGFQLFASCMAYMNSCVNPILYAFFSDNFRKAFKRVLYCEKHKQKGQRMEFERTSFNKHEIAEETKLSTFNKENGNHLGVSNGTKYSELSSNSLTATSSTAITDA